MKKKQKQQSKANRKKVVWGLVIGLAVATLAAAGGNDRHGRRRHQRGSEGRSISEIAAELEKHAATLERHGVSEAQVEAFVQQLKAMEPEIARLSAERESLEAEVAAILTSETIDDAEVAALRSEILSLTERAVALGFDTMVSVAGDLTAEQRRDLVDHWRSR